MQKASSQVLKYAAQGEALGADPRAGEGLTRPRSPQRLVGASPTSLTLQFRSR